MYCRVVNLTTRQYIPEDFKLHTRRRENLKSHKFNGDKYSQEWIVYLKVEARLNNM
jgi:hypothetical protein